jgi:7,8-dihydropterin-6-yl-methyl-4-(beta-D-ribofuranosyl)aminobenzene 5'-phosphate synthase
LCYDKYRKSQKGGKRYEKRGDWMRITVLCEDTCARVGLCAEHGLSLYIETATHKILFDMGQSDLFARNARSLGIDLSEVDVAVLSHGHYDHGGGLAAFLQLNKKANVYVNEYAFGDYYSSPEKYIGLDKFLQQDPRVKLTGEYTKIADGIELFACNAREKHVPVCAFGLTECQNGLHGADRFLHEQYLLLEGKTLVSGCSHKGILNIVEWLPASRVIGGFHFVKLDPATAEGRTALDAAARRLRETQADFYTCHCTGVPQYEYLKGKMPRLSYLSVGDVLEF